MFVIFPGICVFALILTSLILFGKMKVGAMLTWTIITTTLFIVFTTWFSSKAFTFLYYGNFIGIFILIPCLTYLAHRWFPVKSDGKHWLRISLLALAATVLTLIFFLVTMFFSLMYNPMDPALQQ